LQLAGSREPTNVVERWLLKSMRTLNTWVTSTLCILIMSRTQQIEIDGLEKLHRFADNE